MNMKHRFTIFAATLVAFMALAIGVQSASAAQYSIEPGSKYDLRGYVSAPTPLFSCGTGYTGMGRITVHAPYGLGNVRTFLTYYVQYWSNGAWYRYNSFSPNPSNPYVLTPGGKFTFDAASQPSPAGYYRAYARVDFMTTSLSSLGTVNVSPTTATDWSAQYRYNGADGFSYCWHG